MSRQITGSTRSLSRIRSSEIVHNARYFSPLRQESVLTTPLHSAVGARTPAHTGMMLADIRRMKFFCRHCERIRSGHRYRVFSEEEGEILLDMTVCFSCFHQARALGLHAEPIVSKAQRHPQRSEDHRNHGARH